MQFLIPRYLIRRLIFKTYARQATVESIRKKVRDNKNKFALALEAYADLPADLEVAVESRVNTDRVEFIKQCLFKYYQVPERYQCDVWRSARDALNTRVRRLRKKRRENMETVPPQQEQSRDRENIRAVTPHSDDFDEFDEYFFDEA